MKFEMLKLPFLKQIKIGMVVLPKELSKRISRILKPIPRGELIKSANQVSTILRARTTDDEYQRLKQKMTKQLFPRETSPGSKEDKKTLSEKIPIFPITISYDKMQSLAYVAHRMPGIYACNFRILSEVKY